ncbi:hypothetical protein [Qipengyuania sp. MTN3-11]|uniref:hypothetical protein n=1 Tax=Qipengyuania sp. MTN3-11 TaxID=3056557 RepID=UPI0036F19D50
MSASRLSKPRSLWRPLLVPAALLFASLFGLILALTGDGATDWFAAFLLFLPLLAILRAGAGGSSSLKNTR